jgi:RNA polymerase sigma-70 factor (ECF subfamily)
MTAMHAMQAHLILRDVSSWSSDEPPTTARQSADLAETVLIRRVAEGDGEALTPLVERYQVPITSFLHGMLGEREDALDAAQEVFVRVFTQAHRYQPHAPFRSWLYRIATNVAIDQIRRRRRRWFGMLPARPRRGDDSADARDPLDAVASPDDSALDDLLGRESDGSVARAVASLPPPYRMALVLRDLQDLSYEEVAEVLGCRIGTVKSRINRARNLLREKLSATHGGGA